MFQEKNGKLTHTFEFPNFQKAIDFMNTVANISESVNHHPDIFLHDYRFVTITLFTHSENSITKRDHYLAELISKIKN